MPDQSEQRTKQRSLELTAQELHELAHARHLLDLEDEAPAQPTASERRTAHRRSREG